MQKASDIRGHYISVTHR